VGEVRVLWAQLAGFTDHSLASGTWQDYLLLQSLMANHSPVNKMVVLHLILLNSFVLAVYYAGF
jgi:hypothetical protein